MSWLDKIPQKIKRAVGAHRRNVPEGLWSKCASCMMVLYRTDLEANAEVCPKCGYHNRIGARERLNQLLDPEENRVEIGANVEPIDQLYFKDSKSYADRMKVAQKEGGEKDALIVMQGKIHSLSVVVAAFEF